jgi:hypothetical protein
MNSGFPKKLASLKLLEGNQGKHKSKAELEHEAATEPQPEVLSEVPKPPTHLDKEAKNEWYRVCNELVMTSRLTPGMLSFVSHLCYVHAHVIKMEKMDAPPNAALLGQLRLAYESFGLTSRSIGNTKSLNGSKKENKLTKYLKRA